MLENLEHVQLAADLPEDRHYWVYELDQENVLIKPDHPDCPSLTPVRDDDFRFDPRLAPTA